MIVTGWRAGKGQLGVVAKGSKFFGGDNENILKSIIEMEAQVCEYTESH